MKRRVNIIMLIACFIAALIRESAGACTPLQMEFTGGMEKLPNESSMWWTSWTQYNHFAAQGWSKMDGVVVTEHTAFAWVPDPTGAFATPASGLSYSAKWWKNGTKQVSVGVVHTYMGNFYKAADDSTHTF